MDLQSITADLCVADSLTIINLRTADLSENEQLFFFLKLGSST